MRRNRGSWLRFAPLGAIALLPLLSFAAWQQKGPVDLRVQVVDKTVPHHDYREHEALFWLLRHDKVRSTEEKIAWPLAETYVGFRPGPKEFPERGNGTDLGDTDLQNADLLYIADTYGVYWGDYEIWTPGRTHLDFSRKIYGGMTASEMTVVEDFVEGGGSVVAEFNTFASPTPGSVRRRAEELLGVTWTGWTGRAFHDLSDLSDVPVWAPRLWEKQHDTSWSFEGPGTILIHENTTLVVLQTGADIEPAGLRLWIDQASSPLMSGVVDGTAFAYWFDIVRADPGSEILGHFELQLEPSGKEIVRKAGIPESFPAIIRAPGDPLRVYMAGDFSDSAKDTGIHFFEGLPWLHKLGARAVPTGPRAFYWGTYTPFVHNLMRAAAEMASQRNGVAHPQGAGR